VTSVDDRERLRVQLDCGHFVVVAGNRSSLLTTHIRCELCGQGSPLRRTTSFLGPAELHGTTSKRLKAISSASCPDCGGRVSYVPGARLVCAKCGRSRSVPSLPGPPIHSYFALARQLPETKPTAELFWGDCPNCGSLQRPRQSQFAVPCNACGTPLNFLPFSTRALTPGGILPVTVTQETANAVFRRWARRKLFAPHRLRTKQADTLKLVYVPLFVFSGTIRARYSGERGRAVGKGDRRRTSWRAVKGNLRFSYGPTPVDVTTPNPVRYGPSIWPADEAVGLRDEYLLGAEACTYQASPKAAQALVHQSVVSQARSLAAKDIGGEQQRVNSVTVEYETLGLAYMLGPYWSSSFYDMGKTFSFRVNGRTGQIDGSYPKSKPRIMGAVAAAVAVIVLGVVGYQSWHHHDQFAAARTSVCSDIEILWGQSLTPPASVLAEMPTVDYTLFDDLRSSATKAGQPYQDLVQSFVADQAADRVGPAMAVTTQIETTCGNADR
jgi:hypothetical protein